MSDSPDRNDLRLPWTRQLVARFWDYYAQHRPDAYFTHRFGERIVALTARHVPAGGTVCDFGCGAGFLTAHLTRRFRTTGVDFSPANLVVTRARLSGHPNFAGAVSSDDARMAGPAFDAVYLVETVEHLLDGHVDVELAKVFALLRPGGVVIVTTPNEERLSDADVFCPECSHVFHRWQHLRRFDAGSLTVFMGRAGFDRVRTFTTDFAESNLPLLWARRLLARRPLPHLVYVGRKPAVVA